MRKLRLLLFDECNRNCPGCCNKDWDLDKLPLLMSYKGYNQILLTGGEPLLHPRIIQLVVKDIRKENDCPIYLYTAKTDNIPDFADILYCIQGVCVTLHTQTDVEPFKKLNKYLLHYFRYDRSLRLNIFSDIKLNDFNSPRWQIKRNIKWIKNCPLPKDEVFMRL